MKLGGVMIGSEHPKELADFYTKVLGKPAMQQDEWYGYEAGVMIGRHSDVHGKNENPARIIFNFEVSDVKAEFARIKDLGAEVIAEPYQPQEGSDMWLATFADPEGNYLQLAPPWA